MLVAMNFFKLELSCAWELTVNLKAHYFGEREGCQHYIKI